MTAKCTMHPLPQVCRRPSRECALIQMALLEASLRTLRARRDLSKRSIVCRKV
ncbi:hypothetical protein OESDEN_13390 [Oesophagostomum dentatum]|uniref:Uncharacterized protein n=1 Tax=Oesophagostomum dentatum TaxID=61180 RepID=A0A0B1SSG9_OESDE|nr:hypothetical protein OESDEN_13390 [Oesophagostomum dentatum]